MGQVYICIDLNNAEKIVMPENSSKPSISYNSSQNNSALLFSFLNYINPYSRLMISSSFSYLNFSSSLNTEFSFL